MKRLLIAIVAMTATLGVSAQDFRWGPTGAFNFAWAHSSISSSDCYVGFNAGVKAEMDFSDIIASNFFLEGKALYTLKGGAWSGFHQNLGYIEVPVNLGYRYKVGNDVALMGSLGPYFAFGVLGKNVISADGAKVKSDLFGDKYKRFDFGLNYNVGVEFRDCWQLFLGFEHSLMNIVKSDFEGVDNIKIRPLNFYIGAAYMF